MRVPATTCWNPVRCTTTLHCLYFPFIGGLLWGRFELGALHMSARHPQTRSEGRRRFAGFCRCSHLIKRSSSSRHQYSSLPKLKIRLFTRVGFGRQAMYSFLTLISPAFGLLKSEPPRQGLMRPTTRTWTAITAHCMLPSETCYEQRTLLKVRSTIRIGVRVRVNITSCDHPIKKEFTYADELIYKSSSCCLS